MFDLLQIKQKVVVGKEYRELETSQSAALKDLERSTAKKFRHLQAHPVVGTPLLVTNSEPDASVSGVGDTSGLFYYVGTGCGTRSYTNPHNNGLRLTKGGDGTGDPVSGYDYGSGEYLLDNTNTRRVRLYDNYGRKGEWGQPWFQVELTSCDGFFPTHYKLRLGDSLEYVLRDWEFSGSADGQVWDVLSKGSDHPNAFLREEQCKTFPVTGAKGFYKCESR